MVSHGVSPAGEQSQVGAVDEVREALSLAMGGSPCVVRVSAERLDDGAGGASFEISPFLTRYTCSMTFAPWPRELRLPGVSLEAPAVLSHCLLYTSWGKRGGRHAHGRLRAAWRRGRLRRVRGGQSTTEYLSLIHI